jgi:hypothetical protein
MFDVRDVRIHGQAVVRVEKEAVLSFMLGALRKPFRVLFQSEAECLSSCSRFFNLPSDT